VQLLENTLRLRKKIEQFSEIISSSDSHKISEIWRAVLEGKSQGLLLKRMSNFGEEVFYQSVLAPVTDEVKLVEDLLLLLMK
jgi:hypothetical protein